MFYDQAFPRHHRVLAVEATYLLSGDGGITPNVPGRHPMDDRPREILKQLVSQQGLALCNQPRRCRGLLLDPL